MAAGPRPPQTGGQGKGRPLRNGMGRELSAPGRAAAPVPRGLTFPAALDKGRQGGWRL